MGYYCVTHRAGQAGDGSPDACPMCLAGWTGNAKPWTGGGVATGADGAALTPQPPTKPVRDIGQDERGWLCPRCLTINAPTVRNCECRP